MRKKEREERDPHMNQLKMMDQREKEVEEKLGTWRCGEFSAANETVK